MSTPDDIYDKLPWPKPKTHWENDGADCQVTIDEHVFDVRATGDTGIHSGRMRWRVECKTCGVVIHPGSTGASHQIRMHLNDENRKKEGTGT